MAIASTRRALGLSALLAPLGAAAAAVPGIGSDVELLALGDQLAAAETKMNAFEARNPDCTDEELDEAMAPARSIVDRIEHMEAHSLDGLTVKARAISWCNSGEEIDPDRFCPYPRATTDARIAASIVRDLLRRTSRS